MGSPFPHPSASPRSVAAFSLIALGFGLGLVAPRSEAQTLATTYAGRPFIRVARAGVTETGVGLVQGLGRAQVVGEEVAVAALGSGFAGSGWLLGRGGPLTAAASVGTSVPGAAPLQQFHDAMAWRGTPGGPVSFVFPAGASEADGLVRWTSAGLSQVLASGTVLPGSGGKPMNRIGEPYEVGGQLALIGWHNAGSSADFRGVYRLVGTTLQTVADTATALPGAVGTPDTFSSQVGFDGTTLAFWASRGPFSQTQGLFKQATAGGPVVAVLSTGDPLPGGAGTVASLTSPPTVAGGMVWFCAQDGARKNYLIRDRAGVLTVMVREGDAAGSGAALEGLGQLGMEAQGDRLFFGARSVPGPGVYVVDDAGLAVVVPAGGVVAGVRPATIVLQDVEGDTVVLATSGPGAQPAMIVANLAKPALPVIVESPTNVVVAPGGRVELKVRVLGDEPLTYIWRTPAGVAPAGAAASWVIPAASAKDVGFYSVQVTNLSGSVSSGSVLVNVEAPPEITTRLGDQSVEAGDTITVRVTALGGSPLSYFWFRDGVEVEPSAPVAGTFLKSGAAPTDAGLYSVLVSNAWGTARAEVARLSVIPAPPNPVYAGGRFQVLVSGGQALPGSALALGPDAPMSNPARWAGSNIVFTATGPNFEPLGLYQWSTTGFSVFLAPGEDVPSGAGTFDGARVVRAPAGDPVCFVGSSATVPVGIYAFRGGALEMVADTLTPIPEAGGEGFKPFYSPLAQWGERLAFIASGEARQGAYLAIGGDVRRLVDTTMDFPVLGREAAHVQAIGVDGTVSAVLVANRSLSAAVVVRVTDDGTLTEVMKLGDLIPGTTAEVRTFGPLAVKDGAITLFAYDSSFAVHVVQWRDGTRTLLAKPGMEIPGVGTLSSIDSSEVHLAGDKVFLDGRMRRTEGGVVYGVFTASAAGLQSVLTSPKLDARRINGVSLMHATEQRLLLAVRFEQGGAAYVANVGPADAEPPVLLHSRDGQTGLRVTVPAGAMLEAAQALNGVWQTLPGTGEVLIPFDSAARFLRLKRP